MTAIKKEELERLEAEYGLEPDGLTYQHRCSRITAYMNGTGESWEIPPKTEHRQMQEQLAEERKAKRGPNGETISKINTHPLYGKTLLISPLMVPDKNRNISFDEPLGPEMDVSEINAGELLHDMSEDHDRMFGDYRINRIDETKQVIALTGFPKIGTEITYKVGFDLVPVARGHKGARGYVWSFPTCVVPVEDTLVQLQGLKSLITNVAPELLPKFKNKPMMEYVDGVTLVASIPMTNALLKEYAEKELIRERAGLGY